VWKRRSAHGPQLAGCGGLILRVARAHRNCSFCGKKVWRGYANQRSLAKEVGLHNSGTVRGAILPRPRKWKSESGFPEIAGYYRGAKRLMGPADRQRRRHRPYKIEEGPGWRCFSFVVLSSSGPGPGLQVLAEYAGKPALVGNGIRNGG